MSQSDTPADATTPADTTTPFDPVSHLVTLGGKGEYLEVKWRLVWLRDKYPDASVVTEFANLQACDYDQGPAIFKATVSVPGHGVGTGWGSETRRDFGDFIEKAETKAIGRALAALGFGTQFCDDHASPVAGHQEGRSAATGDYRIADSPVDFTRRNSAGASPPARAGFSERPTRGNSTEAGSGLVTEKQVKFIYAIAREGGLDEQGLADWCQELYGQPVVEQLNRRDASTLIEALQRRRVEIS